MECLERLNTKRGKPYEDDVKTPQTKRIPIMGDEVLLYVKDGTIRSKRFMRIWAKDRPE